jgi:hypothetical protein
MRARILMVGGWDFRGAAGTQIFDPWALHVSSMKGYVWVFWVIYVHANDIIHTVYA